MANFFPRWTNYLPLKIIFCLLVMGGAASAAYWWYLTPEYMRQGYQPIQPVPFPHDIHVNQLGMDCRYCHSYVEVSSTSNVPTTQTCMNCHQQIQKDNPKLWAVKQNRGISCVSCHGQINHMDVVYQHEPLTMGWCLNCHRHPEENLRPVSEVFNLDWKPGGGKSQEQIGTQLKQQWNIAPPQNCAGCHR